eukprot:3070539-Pyramimonas_sp.AAC.1
MSHQRPCTLSRMKGGGGLMVDAYLSQNNIGWALRAHMSWTIACPDTLRLAPKSYLDSVPITVSKRFLRHR